ncbi:MAG: CPBP family intramembrane metalloprotease [Clostridia bacterium]|nr:CPBP family intramembrane metalloprotease [Clostridia bacterium]
MRPARLEWSSLKWVLPLAAVAGVLLSLDWWTFGAWIPGLREGTDLTLTLPVVIASILYGGVIEEVMLRLFMMSLLAWLGWKLFFRKAEKAPAGVIIAANVISALLFAAGHLPATQQLFGAVTLLLLLRCFLYNGGAGLFFGWLYRRFGVQYAMIGHAATHIVSKLIWFIFV